MESASKVSVAAKLDTVGTDAIDVYAQVRKKHVAAMVNAMV